jgi:hypothetical protein
MADSSRFSRAQARADAVAEMRVISDDWLAANFEATDDLVAAVKRYLSAQRRVIDSRNRAIHRLLSQYPDEKGFVYTDPQFALELHNPLLTVWKGFAVSIVPTADASTTEATEGAAGSTEKSPSPPDSQVPTHTPPLARLEIRNPTHNIKNSTKKRSNTYRVAKKGVERAKALTLEGQDLPTSSTLSTSITPTATSSSSRTRFKECQTAERYCHHRLSSNFSTTTTTELYEATEWVFSYKFDGHEYAFVLRCPSKSNSCRGPIFKVNPLHEHEAIRHFQQCNVPFDDLADLILKYATQGKQLL